MPERDFSIVAQPNMAGGLIGTRPRGRGPASTRRPVRDGQPAGKSSPGRGETLKVTLARILAATGLEEGHIARLTGLESDGPEGDGIWPAIPLDHPPGIGPPGPREAPAFVEMSARLVARLRRDYGRGVVTDQGRRLGDLPAVAEWLGTLEAGRMTPRT